MASEVRVHEYLEKQVRRLVVKSKTAQKDAVELNLEIRLKDCRGTYRLYAEAACIYKEESKQQRGSHYDAADLVHWQSLAAC